MRRFLSVGFLLVLILSPFAVGTEQGPAALPSPWDTLESGPHAVGFGIFEEVDTSRSVRAAYNSPVIKSRPVRIYMWYPAVVEPGSKPVLFERYAAAADRDVWPEELLPGARRRIGYERRPFARSLGREEYLKMLARPAEAYDNPAAATGTFPLIVVGQGLYYESPVTHHALCEKLASHGFVVATCPLVGTSSPLVNLDVVDLESQVRDMEFVIGKMRGLPFVDGSLLGLLGFDMGGMSSVILAMRNPDVDAFGSIDAGILYGHPSGIPESSPHYDPALLHAPWLHATQKNFGTRPQGLKGVDLFEAAVHSNRYLLLVEGVGHADFTSYALTEERDPIPAYWGPRQGGEKERYEAVCLYLLRFYQRYLLGSDEAGAFLARSPAENLPGLPLTIAYREAVSTGPVYSDFLNAMLAGDIPGATKVAESIRTHRPDSPLHSEEVLNRLGYHLMFSWELMEEATEVFRINTEIHPDSWNAWDSLAESYWRRGDLELALVHVRRVLELNPENERARDILRQLEEALE